MADAVARSAALPSITPNAVVRAAIGLHMVALFVLPKEGINLGMLRPDDVTAILLLLLAGALFLAGGVIVPARISGWIGLYCAYFLLVLVREDVLAGYPQAMIFWIKEVSYIVLGYLIWRSFRGRPQSFLTLAVLLTVPNLLYGAYQIVTLPNGLYGVAAFGHETSPASAGHLYFAYSVVAFLKVLSGGKWARPLLFVSLLFVLLSGSKLAVVGAIAFFGWYLVEGFKRHRGQRAFGRVVLFGGGAVAALTVAAAIGFAVRGEWGPLGRYRGFLSPIEVLVERGIWWKIQWIDSPLAWIVGAGYSPGHVDENGYSFGMAMDNQVLFFLVTGGLVGLVLYVTLLTAIFRLLPARSVEGGVLRALVVSFACMGLGAEVLQLRVPGTLFWIVVGTTLAMARSKYVRAYTRQATSVPPLPDATHAGSAPA